MLPGPIRAPSLFPLMCVCPPTPEGSFVPNSLSGWQCHPPGLGWLPDPTTPPHQGPPWGTLHHPPLLRSSPAPRQALVRARPLSGTPAALFPSLSDCCCPHPIPSAHGILSSLMHGPSVSTQTPVTTHHGPRSPGKAGFRHRSQMPNRGKAREQERPSGPRQDLGPRPWCSGPHPVPQAFPL